MGVVVGASPLRWTHCSGFLSCHSWLTWLPCYSSRSTGPWKMPTISVCFGLVSWSASRCILPCLPHHPQFSSSCSWEGLGFSFLVVSTSVHAWWHCWLVFWGYVWSNPTCALLSGCRFFPVQLLPTALHSLWPLASGYPWWTSGICWQRTAACWRLSLLLSMSLSQTGGQTSCLCWISVAWSF